jgi:uncharacterized repeat protein (TIGR01451 family)
VGTPADETPGNNTAQDNGVFVWRQISLAAARALPINSPVYVSGYVNFPPGLLAGATQTQDEFMMQDAAQGTTGVSVYYSGSTTKFSKFSVGDEVSVRGTLDAYNGKLEVVVITPTSAISTGVNLALTPLSRTTGQIGEGTEGVLVQVSGTVTSVSAPLHVFIDDGNGAVDIFRDQDVPGLSFTNFQVGDRIRVIGVGTQYDTAAPYDTGYEVSVRAQADVVEYPSVISVSPLNNATNVPVNTNITATFNVTMTNVDTTTFLLQGPSGAIAGAVSYDPTSKTATFTPGANLVAGTKYTVTLKSNLQAYSGLSLYPAQDYVWTFTTHQLVPDLSTSALASSGQVVYSGSFVTYTVTLDNIGDANATTTVTDVLPSYYAVGNALDFSQPTTGTLTWAGVVTAGQTVNVQFVARVKLVGQLPIGLNLLFNSATVNDGLHPVFTLDDRTPPMITIYGVYLPLVYR